LRCDDCAVWKEKIEGKTAEEYEDVIRCCDKTLEIYPNHESAKNNKEIAEEKLKEQQRTGKEKKKAYKEASDLSSQQNPK